MTLTLKVMLGRPRCQPAIAKTLQPTFQTCEPPHWTTCEVATSFRQKALYSARVTFPSAQVRSQRLASLAKASSRSVLASLDHKARYGKSGHGASAVRPATLRRASKGLSAKSPMTEQTIQFNDGAAYEQMMGIWSRS